MPTKTTVTVYTCNVCKESFTLEENTKDCENRHITDMSFKCLYNANSKLPHTIRVSFADYKTFDYVLKDI